VRRGMLPQLIRVGLVAMSLVVAANAGAQSIMPIGAPDRIQEHTIPMFRLDTRALKSGADNGPAEPQGTPRHVHQPDYASAVNDLPFGGLIDEGRVASNPSWPGVGATGWYPPDPDIAVGPAYVLEVVNSSIAWYDKATGAKINQQTAATFFSGVAQTTFIFDPKCFYDRLNGRFVVLFVEKNDPSKISNVLIAVSDDSNPTGVWYRYRFDATLFINTTGYWLDYPGFGYTNGAYVVSGNMFGFSAGFAGVQFLVIPSAPLLTGGAASVSYLRDSSGASVQMAEVVDAGTSTAFGVSRSGISALRVYAIQSPQTTSPAGVYANVAVPTNSSPASDATSTNGKLLDTIDGRVFNAVWRGGRLVTAHSSTPTSGAPVAVRWYDVNTGSWPASGTPTLLQAGLVASADTHYFTPAININAIGDIALLFSASSASITANIMTAGRKASDPSGSMGTPVVARSSVGTSYSQGRWGDYFGVDVDPVDDATFWGVGEYVRSDNSWGTEIVNWTVVQSAPNTPGNLTATASSSSQIDLAWNDSGSETSYTVERSTDNTTFTLLTTLGANVTSFSDTGLPASATRYYRVQAHNTFGDSAYSNVASATTGSTATVVPTAPTNLSVQITTSGNGRKVKYAADLTWEDNANNEDAYVLQRFKLSGRKNQQACSLDVEVILAADTTSYTDSGTTTATCRYAVAARNAAGTSTFIVKDITVP